MCRYHPGILRLGKEAAMAKAKLLLLFILSLPAHASTGEIFAELLGRPDRGGIKGSYTFQQYETQGIKNSPERFGLRQHSLDASIPLNSLSDRKWKLLLNAEAEEIRSAARFPDGRPVPNALWNIGSGISYLRTTEKNRTVGGSFLLGSSGDQPFAAARDFLFHGNLVYKIPGEGESAWVFFLNITNNRTFLNFIPLVGGAYFFRVGSSLRIAAGVPFFMMFWTPFDRALFNVSYFPLYNAQAKFSYFLFGPAHLYAQIKFLTKSFFLADRRDSRERIFYEEVYSSTGFAMPLMQNLLIDAALGYGFDRKIFLGKSSTSKKDGLFLRPEKAPLASLKLIASF